MIENTRSAPWYVAGLAFECAGCGGCCAGPQEGYVWVTDEEIAAIAAFLGIDESEMRTRYIRRIGKRHSLIEVRRTNDCIFLSPPDAAGNRGCEIYSVRPTQCRTWPFWGSNLDDPESWSEAARRCSGINRGSRIDPDEIDTRRNATDE